MAPFTVTAFVFAPSVPAPASASVPAVTIVPPVYELAPDRVMVFVPVFTTDPSPVMTLATVVPMLDWSKVSDPVTPMLPVSPLVALVKVSVLAPPVKVMALAPEPPATVPATPMVMARFWPTMPAPPAPAMPLRSMPVPPAPPRPALDRGIDRERGARGIVKEEPDASGSTVARIASGSATPAGAARDGCAKCAQIAGAGHNGAIATGAPAPAVG